MLKNSFSKSEFEAGIDEAGRGSIAGPVTASAVILPKDFNSRYLNAVSYTHLTLPTNREV